MTAPFATSKLGIDPTLTLAREPDIVTWNRLEPRPRTARFTARAVAAEVRDALWFLTRQWQYGEFKGDDAGSPVTASLFLRNARLVGYAGGEAPLAAYDDSVPLEVRVEREPVVPDLLSRIRLGVEWMRFLREAVKSDKYRPLFVAAFPVATPPRDLAHVDQQANQTAMQWRAAASGRGCDGVSVLSALRAGTDAAGVRSGALAVASADATAVRDAARAFVAAAGALYREPEPAEPSAWAPSQLEYQFKLVAADPDQTRTLLSATEHHQGRLDWYAVDAANTGGGEDLGALAETAGARSRTDFLPSPVTFAGMPSPRYWEFEDWRTNFGGVDAHATDLSTVLLMEFALVYGNDWSVIPCTLPVGSLCAVEGLVITDCFGERFLVPPAGRSRETTWHDWSMFALTRSKNERDQRLFIPPVLASTVEGDAVEAVRFIRDEVANMVWAVEATIPDDLGGGMSGFEAGLAVRHLVEALSPPAVVPSAKTDAKIGYRLASTTPEHWIPFVPVRVAGSGREIQLQRGAMPRLVGGRALGIVRPRTLVLQASTDGAGRYFLHEEQVPRAGATVKRSFQLARGVDGQTHLWMGRQKTTGRGEGSSGLAYDWLEDLT